MIRKITQQNLKWSPKNSQTLVQTLLLLEKLQFPRVFILSSCACCCRHVENEKKKLNQEHLLFTFI